MKGQLGLIPLRQRHCFQARPVNDLRRRLVVYTACPDCRLFKCAFPFRLMAPTQFRDDRGAEIVAHDRLGHSYPVDPRRMGDDPGLTGRHLVHATGRTALVEIAEQEHRRDRRDIAGQQHRAAIERILISPVHSRIG